MAADAGGCSSGGDQDASLAKQIADTVTKEVASSVARLLHEIEGRLTLTISKSALTIVEEQRGNRWIDSRPTHSSASDLESDECRPQRMALPQWLQKSLASGNASMQDLETYHTNHLFAARMSERKGLAKKNGLLSASLPVNKKQAAKGSAAFRRAGTSTPLPGSSETWPCSAGEAPPRSSSFHAAPSEVSSAGPRGELRKGSSRSQLAEAAREASRGSAAAAAAAAWSRAARRFRAQQPEPASGRGTPVRAASAEAGRCGGGSPRPSFRAPSGSSSQRPVDTGHCADSGPEAAAPSCPAQRCESVREAQGAPGMLPGTEGEFADGGSVLGLQGPSQSQRLPSIGSLFRRHSTGAAAVLPAQEVLYGEGPFAYVSRQILSSRAELADVAPGETEDEQDGREREASCAREVSSIIPSSRTSHGSLTSVVTFDKSLERMPWRMLPCSGPRATFGANARFVGPLFAVYRGLVIAACVCVVLFCVLQHFEIAANWEHPDVDSTWLLLNFLDLVVALGSLFGFLVMWKIRNSRILAHADYLLGESTYREQLVGSWRATSARRLCAYLFLWLLSLAARFGAELRATPPCWPGPEVGHGTAVFVRVSMFALSSGVLLGSMRCLDRLCRIMMLTVDAFCFYCLHSSKELRTLMEDWSILQALLRQAAGTSELSIFLLLATVSAALVTAILVPMQAALVELRTFQALVTMAPLFLLFGNVLTQAAQVTEKCKRVASLVNSMNSRFQIGDRFYLTQYISQSNAGFYVQEVLVNGTMVLKVGHLTFLAVFAVLSRFLAQG